MNRITASYKGLQFTPVWFEDKSLTSPDYFQITEFPLRLTAGKNLFKLRGHPSNLRIDGVVNIEVLDYNGDPIHCEIVRYIEDDTSRVIAIYVYGDTSPGDCTVTLMAEAENVPPEWKGKYNVKWTRTVPVNPNITNVSEIIFENTPTVTITEQIGPHLDRTYPNNTQFPTYTTGTVRYFSYNKTPAIEIINGSFTNDMINGIITIASPVNPLPTPAYPASTTQYSSTIRKVLSPSLALLDKEFVVYSSNNISPHIYNQFDNSAFSLTYEASPTYTTTQNSESYAIIEIKNLQPATGDVSRIKVFMNNRGTIGTWEPITDIELYETELFVGNTGSIRPDNSIGLFKSQGVIDTYWEPHTYNGFFETTPPILTLDNSLIPNAMNIVNTSNLELRSVVSVAQIKSAYKSTFIENSDYKITLDAIGNSLNNQDAILSLYLSGSSFSYNPSDYFNQSFPVKFGKRIGELRSNTNRRRFDDVVFNFTADKTGDAVLLLVVENGNWQVSNIRTTSDNELGYTPSYTRIKTLVPTAHKLNNQLSFKIEYYNNNGEKSKYQSFVYNKPWEGGNRYIDGEYSMLTGSLYVADSLESGVAISGYKNTGFIRSLGYQGFNAEYPGFLLWSGSALPGSGGTKGGGAYSGVGLELYANSSNYFRYSTTDSEIDIRSNKFFFGNPNTSFISGSGNKLQISSSNFHLKDNGEVIVTGIINITDGNVTPASISGSINSATGSLSGSINTTITNTSSSLSTTITNTSASINTTITNTSASINTTIANTSASINTTITDTSASITNTIVTDANSKIVKPVTTPAGGNGLYLTSRYLGYYSSGDSDWKAYISNSGEFLFKQNDNNLLSFGNNAFTLKTETATISGSAVNLVAPRFWLGDPTSQFISGSNGKLQISASNFSIKADGSITASNMDISGISAASVILNKAVIITAANSSSYLELKEPAPSTTYFTPYYKLHLDGALPGGRSIQKVIINCQFPKSTRSTPAPTWTDVQLAIGDIVFPAGIVGQNGLATCIIEVATSSVYFRDDIPNSGFIPSAWQSLSWNGIINEPEAAIPYSGNWSGSFDGQWNEGPTG